MADLYPVDLSRVDSVQWPLMEGGSGRPHYVLRYEAYSALLDGHVATARHPQRRRFKRLYLKVSQWPIL